MAITMMLISAVISIVFLVDFSKTIFELQRDRNAMKAISQDAGGFPV
ncbi:hypothetical protein [Rhizobium herbae]|uniref:Flp pilus-assembly TadG-like N-terminal domain-containing protein n=1 Tax=Rhizobium herbae TaxID=508661 RepID=A0ABS4EFV5_9HYPH|nr:hypothetical protein [Rhizobium herbae]MBP1856825.1 hypothetical protein [Rhizobium herbae]